MRLWDLTPVWSRRRIVMITGITLSGAVSIGALLIGLLAIGSVRAQAATTGAPLAGPSAATLSQLNASQWQTTVPLDTAALCAGSKAAGNKFMLVTSVPNTVTGADKPAYSPSSPAGPSAPACATVTDNPVTEVTLTFSPGPALTSVPQGATLTVLPPPELLTAGSAPSQIPLTVRRTVSPWQYVVFPAICGGAFALLLVAVLIAFGMPSDKAQLEQERLELEEAVRERRLRERTRRAALDEAILAAGDSEFEQLEEQDLRPGDLERATRAEATEGQPQQTKQPKARRVHLSGEFWRTPLYAGATWSFSDSWVTSITPLGALAGGVATASGAVSGLVPGVDLGRFGLLMALAGGLTTLAPLLFAALNAMFPSKHEPVMAPKGEVFAASLWVMLLAGCLTVFAIGVEVGFVGWVLGFDLIVVSPPVRWLAPAGAGLAALLFLGFSAHSILVLAGQPRDRDKEGSKRRSFMI